MLASSERRRVAATIGTLSRWNPHDPRLPALRQRLNALRVRDVAAWAAAAATDLPDTDEVANVLVRLAQTSRNTDGVGDAA